MLGLKDTILSEDGPDPAELIQSLDDKSLSLVIREATDDGRKALQILRDHYTSQCKPRIIALYTELTSLKKESEETVTDDIIQAEKAVTSRRNVKEVISDGMIIAMILKGLPESYKPFAIHTTQSSETLTFVQFKSKLRSYEETEKFNTKVKSDSVMKADISSIVCYGCGNHGHIAKDCCHKGVPKCCRYRRSSTHSDETCRRKTKHKDAAKQAAEGQEDQEEKQTFVFKFNQTFLSDNIKRKRLMVDCGATSHIITEESTFSKFDETFDPNAYYMELADGTRMNNVVLKQGDAEVCLQDREGRCVKVTLRKALFIPSYLQNILCESSYNQQSQSHLPRGAK